MTQITFDVTDTTTGGRVINIKVVCSQVVIIDLQ